MRARRRLRTVTVRTSVALPLTRRAATEHAVDTLPLTRRDAAWHAAQAFRAAYERGSVPARVEHGSLLRIRWRRDIYTAAGGFLDLLPLFFEGLSETAHPYRFLAVRGCEELLVAARARALPLLPALVPHLRRALSSRDRGVAATAALMLQCMVNTVPGAGQALVPFYPRLLPALRLYSRLPPEARDGHDYGQRVRGPQNLVAFVDETLQVLRRSGRPQAGAQILRIIPTFQCIAG